MQHLFSLQGKTALITGGCRGIGRMMAEGLLTAGAKVFITGRDQSFTEQAAKDLSEQYQGECIALIADIGNKAGISQLVASLEEQSSQLDILINNAALYALAELENTDYDEFNQILQTNTSAAFELSRQLLPLLKAAAKPYEPARIINISSNVALMHCAWGSWAYATAKRALLHLTEMLASELTSQGINVNAIAPGMFDTRMIDDYRDENGEMDMSHTGIPIGRLGEAEDIQGMVIALCSRAGAFTSGAIIPVDGASVVRPMY